MAREQIVGDERACERCRTPVLKRNLEQWFFRITRYADELLDFSKAELPERVQVMQTNWIGRTHGVDIDFELEAGGVISVFTTRCDTVFGVSFLAMAPEHPLVERLTSPEQRAAVAVYAATAARQSEIQRLSSKNEKTGVFSGAFAVNPVNGERVPIFVSDYVLMQHGTGAVMGVPAHDTRDFTFAKRFGLPLRVVVQPSEPSAFSQGEPTELSHAYVEAGVLVASGDFDGMEDEQARDAIADWLQKRGQGRRAVRYRLRDWLVSRQRYWGTPIPIVHCPNCGPVAVKREELPVLLPDDVDFLPTGESPLKQHADFVNTACPACGGAAERETDTMDTFVDSSWYWYRYLSPHHEQAFFDRSRASRWLPVTEYGGGIEHATMHLLYARFFAKALRDLGHAEEDEPFARVFNQGLVLGEDGEKMSKSRGNVIDPDAEVETSVTNSTRRSRR